MKSKTLLAAALLTLAASCANEIATPESLEIDSYIRDLPYLPAESSNVNQGSPSAPAREGDYQCTTTNLRETKQFDRIVGYAANSESMWPGAIVAGDSVYSGLFTQMVFDRAPETISISLENLQGKKSATLRKPSLSSYREAISSILTKEITGATAANIYSEIEQVHSEKQLSLALGADVKWFTGSVAAKFDWSNKNTRSRYLVRYTQAYYTVDLDAPKRPSALFAPNVTLEELSTTITPMSPPVYVSSVTYGRMVVFSFESDYSAEEMESALQFAYSSGTDVSGQVSVTYKDILNKSKITAYILGGSAGQAAKTIDSYEALIAFLKDGGDYSAESPGAPIAYKLAYLKDNSPARLSFASDYEVKECNRISQKVKVTVKGITVESAGDDAGDDLELFGAITASAVTSANIWNRGSGSYVTLREGETYPTAAALGEAVIDVDPRAGAVIKLRANLTDFDDLSGNDGMGDVTVDVPFETGWRREVPVMLTGDGARVKVVFALQPI